LKNKVQLISYIDRFGKGTIDEFHNFLKENLHSHLEGGVHLLPFFSHIDGADAGYDPMNHKQVDVRLGNWENIKDLSQDFDLVVDLIVNHMSDESIEFKSVQKEGSNSPYFDLFLTKDKVFKNDANENDISKIFRPRPNSPFLLKKLDNGESHEFWTTFSEHQIDIDIKSDIGKKYIESIIETFATAGVKMIRLDAIGYCIKKPGTSCFMLEETLEYISELTEIVNAKGIKALAEIHAHYETQIEIAKRVDFVYDFALPPLILHTLYSKNTIRLKQWLAISPRNCITVLDTHDGIGVADLASVEGKPGMLSDSEINELVNNIHINSKETSRKATGTAASNLDIYQVNCSFYDALGRQDNLYLIARAIQFFCPGIPQVYYGGLLAAENEMELLEQTKVGRDINRPYFDFEEISKMLDKDLVKDLLKIIEFRNSNDSFNGEFELINGEDGHLNMRWTNDKHWSELSIDLVSMKMEITYTNDNLMIKHF